MTLTYILEKPSLAEELTEEVVLNIEEKHFFLAPSDTVKQAVAARPPTKLF